MKRLFIEEKNSNYKIHIKQSIIYLHLCELIINGHLKRHFKYIISGSTEPLYNTNFHSLLYEHYLQMLTFLRRIDTPSGDITKSKMANPRNYHPSQTGFLCPSDTPEHARIGNVKHLSIIGSVTIPNMSQVEIIKQLLIQLLQTFYKILFFFRMLTCKYKM